MYEATFVLSKEPLAVYLFTNFWWLLATAQLLVKRFYSAVKFLKVANQFFLRM